MFGQREDDIRLAEAVYYLARGFDAFETSMLERAGELASSVRREYLSKPLISVYDTLQRLVRENIRLEEKYTPMETFVLVDVFRAGKYIEYLCVEQARKEQEAREAEARREQEAREAEAKLERERQTADPPAMRRISRNTASWQKRKSSWGLKQRRQRHFQTDTALHMVLLFTAGERMSREMW